MITFSVIIFKRLQNKRKFFNCHFDLLYLAGHFLFSYFAINFAFISKKKKIEENRNQGRSFFKGRSFAQRVTIYAKEKSNSKETFFLTSILLSLSFLFLTFIFCYCIVIIIAINTFSLPFSF